MIRQCVSGKVYRFKSQEVKKNFSIVDAHLHIWNPRELSYPWLSGFPSLNQIFDIDQYKTDTSNVTVDKMIFVQCECIPSQFKNEIEFAMKNATRDKRVQAIVCWYPLQNRDALEYIEEIKMYSLIKGIRCLETSDSLYRNTTFIKNVKSLGSHKLSFDLCTQAAELPNAILLAENCPETLFIIDHMGKPNASGVKLDVWKKNIIELSKYPHVYCKVSGIVPEAKNKRWHKNDLRQYFDVVVENFGGDRIVFGSDWPVVNLSASLEQWYLALMELCVDFEQSDLDKLFYHNACKFYRM